MKIVHLALASVAALSLAACAAETPVEDTAADTTAMAEDMAPAGTIVEVAQGNDVFSTLVTAVTAAELGETLERQPDALWRGRAAPVQPVPAPYPLP
jgi:uncharacterized surface protein with fasciclin (FAS1) repeats